LEGGLLIAAEVGVVFDCTLEAVLDAVVLVLSGVTLPALNVRELLLEVDVVELVFPIPVRLVGKVGVKDGGGTAGGAEGAADEVLVGDEFVLEREVSFMIPGMFPPTEVLIFLAIVVGLLGEGVAVEPVLGVRFGIDGEFVFVWFEAVCLGDDAAVEEGLASSNSPCCPL
jgi:hypothetical protein